MFLNRAPVIEKEPTPNPPTSIDPTGAFTMPLQPHTVLIRS